MSRRSFSREFKLESVRLVSERGLTTYAYRLTESDKLIKPYLFRSTGLIQSDSELFAILREEYGGGVFRIFVREGSRMVLSGDVGAWGRRMDKQLREQSSLPKF